VQRARLHRKRLADADHVVEREHLRDREVVVPPGVREPREARLDLGEPDHQPRSFGVRLGQQVYGAAHVALRRAGIQAERVRSGARERAHGAVEQGRIALPGELERLVVVVRDDLRPVGQPVARHILDPLGGRPMAIAADRARDCA
jgi:hypothetical protein